MDWDLRYFRLYGIQYCTFEPRHTRKWWTVMLYLDTKPAFWFLFQIWFEIWVFVILTEIWERVLLKCRKGELSVAFFNQIQSYCFFWTSDSTIREVIAFTWKNIARHSSNHSLNMCAWSVARNILTKALVGHLPHQALFLPHHWGKLSHQWLGPFEKFEIHYYWAWAWNSHEIWTPLHCWSRFLIDDLSDNH